MTIEPSGQPAGGTPGSVGQTATAPAAPLAPMTTTTPPAGTDTTTAPTVTTTTSQAPAVTQTGDKPWWDGIQEAPVRELMEKKNYASPNELAMAYYNANKLVSGAADAVIIPAPDAPAEAWADFKKKMGVPETPDAYQFKYAEGVQVDPAMEKFGKELFHKLMLSPSQAQVGVTEWNTFVGKYNAEIMQRQQAQNDQELVELTNRFGPELKMNLQKGNEVMKIAGLSEDLISRVESKIGSAAVIELLASIGKAANPGGSFKATGDAGSGPSGDAAKSEINRLMADPAYSDARNPQHKELVDRVAKLFAAV